MLWLTVRSSGKRQFFPCHQKRVCHNILWTSTSTTVRHWFTDLEHRLAVFPLWWVFSAKKTTRFLAIVRLAVLTLWWIFSVKKTARFLATVNCEISRAKTTRHETEMHEILYFFVNLLGGNCTAPHKVASPAGYRQKIMWGTN